jgi:tRNA(adenine34) deaminase
MFDDEYWMRIAIQEAIIAKNKGEVPIGSILVKDNQLISKAHNCPISTNNPTAHAEIEVLRNAGKKLKNYRLSKTTLYVTLEPCIMCLGAMMHARVERLVFGASNTKKGLNKSFTDVTLDIQSNHKIKVSSGILEEDCAQILNSFFILCRNKF